MHYRIMSKPPTSVHDCKKVSADSNELWSMSHCLGALDGKHVGIRKPASSGSLWYNYKGYFWVFVMHGTVSVMLMLENMVATTTVES